MGLGAVLGKEIRVGRFAWPLWAPVALVGYVWLPADLMPDATPIVGWWDDLLVGVLIVLVSRRQTGF